MRAAYSVCSTGLMLAAFLSGGTVSAQQGDAPKTKTEQAPGRPAGRPGFGPPIVSPEVQPDRHVTFRLRAPAAKEVKVLGEWGAGPTAMVRDEQGTFSVTVGPLAADIYGYSFSVDGFQTLDPANPALKPMRSPRTSILEVPGEPPRLHEFQNVPHGTVRVHEHRSRSLGRLRRLHVYTPPGYDADSAQRFPVLYLLHGAGDNDATWTVFGHANQILDNLLAAGKVNPMIVVMPDGHAATPGQPPGAAPGRPPGAGGGMSRNIESFQSDLFDDVIPLVEASYRVRAQADSRAIAGLSMGGGQSLTIGLNHPDRFAWVGGFSSAVFSPETTLAGAVKDAKATNAALRVLWIACGKDDRLIENNQRLSALLKEKKINHEFLTTDGSHSWPVWRRYLADFVPLLFVAKP
jgi:enterochelin esterase-like enzyme